MNTTVYKANTVVDSLFNLKYLVYKIISYTEGYIRVYAHFGNYNNDGLAPSIRMLVFNQPLSDTSYSGAIGKPSDYLVSTTQVGEDTVYEYLLTARTTGPAFFVKANVGTTKIMIEPVEGVCFRVVTSESSTVTTTSKEGLLMHFDTVAKVVPNTFSSYDYSNGVAMYSSLYLDGMELDQNTDISEFNGIMRVCSTLYARRISTLRGDINNIAANIDCSKVMKEDGSTTYACNGARADIASSKNLYGDATQFVNTILGRGVRNFAFQLYLGSTQNPNIVNVPGPSSSQVLAYIDNNGNVSYYSSVANWKNALPVA